MKKWRGRIVRVGVALAVIAGLAYAFWPAPVAVELAPVVRGPMQVTVEDDGQTRVRERYVIAAPMPGRVLRIDWDAGDEVRAGYSVLATLVPEAAAPLDVRAQAQARARVDAARAAVEQAQANAQRSEAALELAESEWERLRTLLPQGAATQRETNDARLITEVRRRELDAARHALSVARFELELAQAALVYTMPESPDAPRETQLDIVSPIDGRILRIPEKSARPVTAGQTLMEIGDPRDLEVQVDVLSSDAVRIKPGQEVWFDNWGGDQPLRGVVRVVEPFAFTKVSALGVEEQRALVIADFTDPPERWAAVGDGYRVDARFVVWQADDLLKVPTSALFRQVDQWCVFVERAGRAELRPIKVGRQTALEAQVLDGLQEGERVIAFPSDQVSDGVRIATP